MTLTKLGQMCSKTCRVSMLFLLILILFELYFRPSLYIKSIYYLILSHYTSQFWGFGVLHVEGCVGLHLVEDGLGCELAKVRHVDQTDLTVAERLQ